MKPRFPLSTKIYFLALLNLLLLSIELAVFARWHFHTELGSLLFSAAEERVVATARLLALDLAGTPRPERDELLRRYARTYGVGFYLFDQSGAQDAGPAVQLPAHVMDEVRRPPPRGEGQPRGEGPPPRREPPPPRHRGPALDEREPPAIESEKGERPPRKEKRQRQGQIPEPFFQVVAGNPKLYWVGVRIPIGELGGEVPERGAVLMTSPSFVGTPLFFDYKPWLAAAGAMIAVFVLCWLPLIRGLSRSITRMTKVTGQIAEGRFDQQLADDRGDELGLLASAINRMAARLAGFVTGQKRFLGDIAHELCSPIARIQFALGILEQRADEGQRSYVSDLQDEVRQMSSLVSELLQFSKAGMQAEERQLVAVDVGQTAVKAAEREGGGQAKVEVQQELRVLADPEYFLRALCNLVRNAVRYDADAGPVTIGARREGDSVVITVEDNGPGMPEEELDRVFTPFYRLEPSRNRSMGGVGLGLAIVKGCVEGCGGTVQCRNRTPHGLAVEIRLRAAG